jgi:anthranilate phosphoribosyltransferase
LINAGACIYIAGKAASIKEGIEIAKATIDSGKATEVLEKFVKLTNE